MFKFIHAADLHLDSPLRKLERYDGAPVEDIRGATRRALANLVQLAIDEEVAFVLIAGDVYDGNTRDFKTGLYFASEMSRLADAGILVFLISGNHDAENRMTRLVELPKEMVYRFRSKKPETRHIEDLGVSIHGQSFATPAVNENLAEAYPRAVAGHYNVGLLHTCVDQEGTHPRYAPCSLDELRSKEYEYWALGHIHKRERLCSDAQIHFSGNTQGRHINEEGAKGCLLVSVDDFQRTEVRFEPLDVFRWHRANVDATDAQTEHDVLERVLVSLGESLSLAEGRPVALRVNVSGSCRAHRELASQPLRWKSELRAAARNIGAGQIWIEQAEIQTTPERDFEDAAFAGPLGELAEYIAELRDDPNTLAWLHDQLTDLTSVLPAELREGESKLNLATALAHVQPLLLSRLLTRTTPR